MCWIWRWCSYIWDIDGWRERGREQRMGSILKSRFIAIASYSWIYFVAYLTHQRIVWREPNVACRLENFLFEERVVGLWISSRKSVCSRPELMLTRVRKQEKGLRITVMKNETELAHGWEISTVHILPSSMCYDKRIHSILKPVKPTKFSECTVLTSIESDVWIGPAMYQLRSSFFQRGQIVTTGRYGSTPRISHQELDRPLRHLPTGDRGMMVVVEQKFSAM